jgi:hypothetical protein
MALTAIGRLGRPVDEVTLTPTGPGALFPA